MNSCGDSRLRLSRKGGAERQSTTRLVHHQLRGLINSVVVRPIRSTITPSIPRLIMSSLCRFTCAGSFELYPTFLWLDCPNHIKSAETQ